MGTTDGIVQEARRLEIIMYEIPGPGAHEHSQIRCIWRSSRHTGKHVEAINDDEPFIHLSMKQCS